MLPRRERHSPERKESERELRPDSVCESHMKKIFLRFRRWDLNSRKNNLPLYFYLLTDFSWKYLYQAFH